MLRYRVISIDPRAACLVAIMSQGPGYHRVSEARLRKAVENNGAIFQTPPPSVASILSYAV
jgi:hypothetical protein